MMRKKKKKRKKRRRMRWKGNGLCASGQRAG